LAGTSLFSFLEKLLTAPQTAALAALLLAIYSWPRIRELLYDVFPSQRQFRREKQKLELLKLMYEVEAIKKQHDLGELASRLPASLQSGEIAREIQNVTTAPPAKKPIPLAQRLLFGCIGSLALLGMTLLPLYIFVPVPEFGGVDVAWTIVLTGFGGVASWLFRSKSRMRSIIHGTVPIVLLILLVLIVNPPPPLRRME
jgi:hypothetical protein